MTVIFIYSSQEIEDHPEYHESEDFHYFRPAKIPLFFGVVVFNFEGNAILLNIHSSMKQPEKFNQVFTRCFFFIVCLVACFAAVCYSVLTSQLIFIGIWIQD